MTYDLAARLGELGSVRPRELSATRDTSLGALQVVAVASTWLPAAPDHHHWALAAAKSTELARRSRWGSGIRRCRSRTCARPSSSRPRSPDAIETFLREGFEQSRVLLGA